MGILNWFQTDDETEERPPKPEDESKQRRVKQERFEATVHYRNGDVETFDCYGIFERGDDVVKFNISPYPDTSEFRGQVNYGYERRKINYETLSREPTVEKVATDEFVIDYTLSYYWGSDFRKSTVKKTWKPTVEDLTLTINKSVE